MCRMLIVVGDVDTELVFDDFKLIAGNRNEQHENNVDEDFTHGDGWGFSYFKNGKLQVLKSTVPYYEDPQAEEIKKIKSPLYILHARRKSEGKGLVRMENVHPFQYDDYVFFHNGTVYQNLHFDSKFTVQGETDSEQLFYYLLSAINGDFNAAVLQDRLNAVTDYSGMNAIFSDGEITYVINWYAKNPNYYRIKMLQHDKFLMISSEILPSLKNENWIFLDNKDIIRIDTATREYSVVKYNG